MQTLLVSPLSLSLLLPTPLSPLVFPKTSITQNPCSSLKHTYIQIFETQKNLIKSFECFWVLLMGILQEPNVFFTEQEKSNPSISDISVQSWSVADTTTNNIISHLQPTLFSDTRRIQVINFIHNLFKKICHIEVYI